MKIALVWLAGIALAAASSSGLAQNTPSQPTRYRVEVILFAHADFDASEEEFDTRAQPLDLPDIASVPARTYFDEMMRLSLLRQIGNDGEIAVDPSAHAEFPADVLALERFTPDDGGSALEFRVLDRDELALSSIYSRIERASGLRALAHGGWVQAGLPDRDAVAFDVGLIGSTNPRGTITLAMSRYPHVEVDLSYQPVPDEAAAAANASTFFNPFAERESAPLPTELGDIELPPRYTLQTERVVDLNKLTHIDFPAFGLLVLVTREPEDGQSSGDGSSRRSPAI